MKPRYFRIGAVLGLCLFPLIVSAMVGKEALLIFLMPLILGPLAAGYFATYQAASWHDYFDGTETLPGFARTYLVLLLVYAVGIVVGSVANFLLNGVFGDHPFGIWKELSLLTGPLFWLVLFGPPGVLLVAALLFAISLRSRRA